MPEHGQTEQRWGAIVIGGGFAGLSAARELDARGKRVLVLEARDRLGGRTWYRRFADSGYMLDFGGQWIATDWQPHMEALVTRHGLAIEEGGSPTVIASLVAGQRLTGLLPVPMSEIFAFERLIYELIHAARRLDRAAPLAHPLADLDIPFTDFLRSFVLPEATCDYALAWVAGAFGCDPSAVSTLAVLAWIADYDCSVIALHLGESQAFAHGTEAAIAAMRADLRAEIRLNTVVRSVAQGSDGVSVTSQAGEHFTAAAAVVALPVNVWHTISFSPALSEAKQTLAREGHTGHATKVWALVGKAPEPFHGCGQGPGLTWLGTQQMLPEGNLMVGFGPGPSVIDVHSVEDVQRNVSAFVPGAEVLQIDAHDWSADPFALGAWVAWRPGQLTRWGTALRAPEGRIAFAGSDIATKWAGWMEGALSSGIEAGRYVADLLTR